MSCDYCGHSISYEEGIAHSIDLRMKQIEGQWGARGLHDLDPALCAGHMKRPQLAVVQDESENGLCAFFGLSFNTHVSFVPLRMRRVPAPSAHPKLV